MISQHESTVTINSTPLTSFSILPPLKEDRPSNSWVPPFLSRLHPSVFLPFTQPPPPPFSLQPQEEFPLPIHGLSDFISAQVPSTAYI